MKILSHDWFLARAIMLNGFVSASVKVPGGEIHYFKKEPKNPKGAIVFLHGIGASSGHFWKVAGPMVRAGYSVYLPDLPGHGLSPDPVGAISSQSFYRMFVGWVDKTVSDKFILVGNSMGGAVSLRFALEHPESLHRLILISPGGGFETESEWNEFKKLLSFKSIRDSRKFVPKIFHSRPFYLPLLYRPFLENMSRKGIQDLIQSTSFQDFEDPILRARERFQSRGGSFPTTLFIWGKSEKLFPPGHLLRFKRLLASHVVFEEPEGVGHCPQLENARWLCRKILEFSN